MIRIDRLMAEGEASLPRMRGDDPAMEEFIAQFEEFAPHARG